jgi:hypothetical protein
MIVTMAGFGMTGVEPTDFRTAMLELCHLEVNINTIIIVRTLIFNPDLYQNFTQHNQRDQNQLVC